MQIFEDRPVSATGVATSKQRAVRMAKSEMQERVAQRCLEHDPRLSGYGAATKHKVATARAHAELVERWAVWQWWLGGERLCKASENDLDIMGKALQLYQWRTPRKIALAEISRINGFHVMVAWSRDQDERGICLGYGASWKRKSAIKKALRELVQMEFSLGLSVLKRSEGVSLGREERLLLDRAGALNCSEWNPLCLYRGERDSAPMPRFEFRNLPNPIGDRIIVQATICSAESPDTRSMPWGPY